MRLALVALVAGLVFVACDDGEPEPVGEVTSFLIEAEFGGWENSENVGTNLPVTGEAEEIRGTIRWWSRSSTEFRQELHGTGDDGEPALTLIVGTGDTLVFYNSERNTFQSQPMFPVPEGLVAWPIPASFFLGPLFDEEAGGGFEGAMASLEEVNDRPRPVVELDGERVAGRETRVFEAGPVGCSLTTLAGSNVTPVPECTGTLRIWIDAETGFVLRYEAEDPDVLRIEVEVTKIDYSPKFDHELFRFEAPAGAVEEE